MGRGSSRDRASAQSYAQTNDDVTEEYNNDIINTMFQTLGRSSSPQPPPPYTPPADSSSQARTRPMLEANTSYNTFAPPPSGGSREPESMGAPEDVVQRESLLPQQHTQILYKRYNKKTRFRKCLKHILFALLALAILASTTMALISAISKTSDDVINKPDGSHKNPPSSTKPTFPGIGNSYCREATIHKTTDTTTFGLQNQHRILIKQSRLEDGRTGRQNVRTVGRVSFQSMPEDLEHQDGMGYVTFDAWVSDQAVEVSLQLDDDNEFTILTPISTDGPTVHEQACVSVEMVVWLPRNALFNHITVSTWALDIIVVEGIQVHVDDSIQLATASGEIIFPNIEQQNQNFATDATGFTSRKVKIHTDSGDIQGTYSLYDELSVSTHSGTTEINVIPEKASKDHKTTPASLDISSDSGSISAWLPRISHDDIPHRDYQTEVRTQSGSIQGIYYLGSVTEVSTASGAINIQLVPGLQTTQSMSLHTKTFSGDTKVKVLADSTRTVLDNLVATHEGKSGKMYMDYVKGWKGEIDVSTISGDIHVQGDGIKVIQDDREGWVKRVFKAIKGNGKGSQCSIESVSGGVDVRVG